jgi:4'-phosphopantetheinyl transferase
VPTVEVWQARLAQEDDVVGRLAALLSPDEHERAARLANPGRWIVARAALRVVLAGRLDAHPRDVAFAIGPHGKPELPAGATRFNLSHSGDLAVIALAEHTELGVDVERTSRRSAAIERTLTAGERAALGGADRHTALLRVWCRKEAMAKAGGGGLGWAPEAFDTSRPGELSLTDLRLDDGYVGALAVHGGPPVLVRHRVDLARAPGG